MLFVEKILGQKFEKIILLVDELAGKSFLSKNWMTTAFEEFGIKIEFVKLPKKSLELLLEEQKENEAGMKG